MDERFAISKSFGDDYNAAYNDLRHIEIQKQIDQISFGKYEPAEPPNPHETTTDLLNASNEEPPSLCNL
jgi:hypothetical protein